jgi:hypothetical protein
MAQLLAVLVFSIVAGLVRPAVALARESPPVRRALALMASPSLSVQQEGLQAIATLVHADESVRSRSDVQLALTHMLNSETLRLENAGLRGEAEDDAYLQSYFENLMPAALVVLPHSAGRTETSLLKALLEASFNTDTAPSRAIASTGEPAAVLILPMARGSDSRRRDRAYDLLSHVLVFDRAKSLRKPLRRSTESAARRPLLRGLRDPQIVGRREAVRGVERARLKEAVPVLKELAAEDPDDGRQGNGPLRFSVRGLAAKALATLANE